LSFIDVHYGQELNIVVSRIKENNMRKVQFVAVILTLAIATPVTALAILLSGFITDNMTEIARFLNNITQTVFNFQRDLLLETEFAGLIAGTIIVLILLGLAIRVSNGEEKKSA